MIARIAVTLAAVCLATAASAHAVLDRAEPKVGATVQEAPAQVRLWFSEAVEPAFSRIEVFDAGGKRVATGRAGVDKTDHKLLLLDLPRLPEGAYVVVWRVVSVDTHVTEGRFAFRIGH